LTVVETMGENAASGYMARIVGGKLRCSVVVGANSFEGVGDVGTIPTGERSHVACVKLGAPAIGYVNGAAVGTYNLSTATMDYTAAGAIHSRIGVRPEGIEFFQGVLDDVRIYDRALTSTKVE